MQKTKKQKKSEKKKEEKRKYKRHREETHTGCVLSNAGGRVHLGWNPGKLQKVQKPQRHRLLVKGKQLKNQNGTERKIKKVNQKPQDGTKTLCLIMLYTHSESSLRKATFRASWQRLFQRQVKIAFMEYAAKIYSKLRMQFY